jgi:hypothetical protein
MQANELNDDPDSELFQARSPHFKDNLPYNIHSTNGTVDKGGGGVAVLVYKSIMSHRILGKPSFPAHKRWMTITIATPDEHIKLVATYMRHHSPTHRPGPSGLG